MEPSIRLADRNAATVLTGLHRRCAHSAYAHIFPPEAAPPTFEEDLARWELWLGPEWDDGRRAYVATLADDVIGVVLAGPDPDDRADDRTIGHLARLYVDPAHWSRGIGTQLYRTAMADLATRFHTATLWVLEKNTRARTWYERLGWTPTGARKTMYAPSGVDDLQYSRTLSS